MATDPDVLNQLQSVVDQYQTEQAEVRRRLHDGVAAARASGASWTDIGKVMGITRQAAWERFKDVDETDNRGSG